MLLWRSLIICHALFQFEKKVISEKYKDQDHTFDVWMRPIWEWVESMLQDPQLIHHFVWDACKMSKFDGESSSWVRFYDEPWTATQFWKIQVCNIFRFSTLIDVLICSRAFRLGRSRSFLSSTRTRQSCPRLAHRRDTPSSLGVQTSR